MKIRIKFGAKDRIQAAIHSLAKQYADKTVKAGYVEEGEEQTEVSYWDQEIRYFLSKYVDQLKYIEVEFDLDSETITVLKIKDQ